MAQIISHREYHEEKVYHLSFHWYGFPGAGFWFPCDKDGNLDEKWKDSPSYLKCINGEHDVVADGVVCYTHRWTDPAILKCDCGAEVDLYGFTNTCHECGADYNMSGQRLAPRSQWGEETGESLSDIMAEAAEDFLTYVHENQAGVDVRCLSQLELVGLWDNWWEERGKTLA